MTTRKTTTTRTMKSPAKTSASKLASSVRRAKNAQTNKAMESKDTEKALEDTSASREETIQPMPSSHVWPD